MNPKTLLITTVIGIATTAAFGAASLRAPQIGGTSTVATPTATTNTARAGTLRTQTMKTSSVSTPSVATQSIATPVETNESRLALLKGIKGFNPGQIKDATAAQQELNAIGSRINELQTQLDRAETAQSTVLTEETIDAKIAEKISQLETSTSTNDSYSKTEMNALLAALESKIPTIDNNGNLNFTDSNGATIAQILPYNLYSTHKYNNLASTQTYKLIAPHDFKTSSFGSLAQDYTRDWVSDICATERSNPDLVACGFYNAVGKDIAMTEFNTISCFKGMQGTNASVKDNMVNIQYTTFEDLNETQINNRFCSGASSSDECSISEYAKKPMGACAEKTFTLIETIERAMGQQGDIQIKCSNPECTPICSNGETPSGTPTQICDCYRVVEGEGAHLCNDSYITVTVR